MKTRTSRAGTWARIRSSPRAGPGFTLIEVMVVMVIIGLVAAVVVPRMGAMDGVQLRSAARKMVGAIRLTYSAAAISRVPHRIAFDLTEQTYVVEELAGDEYVEVGDQLLAPVVLPEFLYFKRIEVVDRECSSFCEEYIYFTPGGYVEEAAIYLATEDDSQIVTIFTRPMVGKAVIVLEEISREEWEEQENLR